MRGGVILRLDFKNNWMFMKQHATNQEDKNKYFLGLQPLSRQHRRTCTTPYPTLCENTGTQTRVFLRTQPQTSGVRGVRAIETEEL